MEYEDDRARIWTTLDKLGETANAAAARIELHEAVCAERQERLLSGIAGIRSNFHYLYIGVALLTVVQIAGGPAALHFLAHWAGISP